MKIESLYNAVFGVVTEVLYAIAIIFVAFLICFVAYFFKL